MVFVYRYGIRKYDRKKWLNCLRSSYYHFLSGIFSFIIFFRI